MRQRMAIGLWGLVFAAAGYAAESRFDAVAIVAGGGADAVERRCVELLQTRLREITSAPVAVGTAPAAASALVIHIGTADSHPDLAALADALEIPMPAPLDPGAEGFVIAKRAGDPRVIAAGADVRGVFYAVGELLRQAVGRGAQLGFPDALHRRCAPRWPVRGQIVGQGHTMRELTGARAWTREELERAHLDYALAGANTFELGVDANACRMFDFLKSYGLAALTVVDGNTGKGPAEWAAKESIGRPGYLCPAVPEARAALLAEREALFKTMPDFDYVHIKSGDGGGDECEAAAPYGKTFIALCEDYARLLHRYHPNTRVFAGNQKLDNAGDAAMLAYFQATPDTQLEGIVYGPGSNAMGWTPGRRQDHRMDLFVYARTGALSGYLREMLHDLPANKSILLFTDLTHWVYSQYGLMDHELIPDRQHQTPPAWDNWMYGRRPDAAMEMVYDRRTFHARPRNYYRVFQETAAYAIGDVAYSEGHHDHLNTWIYQRLFWNPEQGVEDVVAEYARTHFGPEAAPAMAEAIFTLETNLETPIDDNPGIDRLVALVEQAGGLMPEDLRARNYLWRQYAQKAYLDKYIQLDVRRQKALAADLAAQLQAALDAGDVTRALANLAEMRLPEPTPDMARLRDETDRLGRESDALYGVRNDGLSNLRQDYIGFGWLMREIKRAAALKTEKGRQIMVRGILHYTDPGEGGFYDNAGVPGECPHLVYGWPYGDGEFSGDNRPSQRTMAFTTDEERGVTFRYKGLDPAATYRVRLTLVRPRFQPRFGMFQPQTSQSIYADDILLADVELPEFVADFFEFDIPPAATSDGELLLWMKKQKGIGEGLASDVSIWRNTGGWGTLVSEVWLMKAPLSDTK